MSEKINKNTASKHPDVYLSEAQKLNSSFEHFEDRRIWREFKQGNRAAFIHIYNAYFEDLFAYARQFTSDVELIKDAIQDVYVRINETKAQLSDTDSIKFYLYKSVKREVIYNLQQLKRSADKAADLRGQGFEYELSFEDVLINRQISEETVKKIRDAANSLNDKQREIIFYHFFEGFSIKQIMELMKFGSIQATHNLLKRALDQLREVLGIFLLMTLLYQGR